MQPASTHWSGRRICKKILPFAFHTRKFNTVVYIVPPVYNDTYVHNYLYLQSFLYWKITQGPLAKVWAQNGFLWISFSFFDTHSLPHSLSLPQSVWLPNGERVTKLLCTLWVFGELLYPNLSCIVVNLSVLVFLYTKLALKLIDIHV